MYKLINDSLQQLTTENDKYKQIWLNLRRTGTEGKFKKFIMEAKWDQSVA